MTNPRDIGARIRTAREEQGWTQDQLAAEVGVSRSAVAQWETGRAGQVTTNLTRVAASLGIGVSN
jgi:transcriptional regulator with XRE-family HTH domain